MIKKKKKQFKLIVNGIDLSELPIHEYALEHNDGELNELNLRIIGADIRLSDGDKEGVEE